jgi:hypothetical protein
VGEMKPGAMVVLTSYYTDSYDEEWLRTTILQIPQPTRLCHPDFKDEHGYIFFCDLLFNPGDVGLVLDNTHVICTLYKKNTNQPYQGNVPYLKILTSKGIGWIKQEMIEDVGG